MYSNFIDVLEFELKNIRLNRKMEKLVIQG